MRNLLLSVALLLALAPCAATAQSVYDFTIDPDASNVRLDFSVSYQGDPWIQSHDSSPVQGAWQGEYAPGTGDLQTVSLRGGAIVLNEDLSIGGSKKIAVIELSVHGTLRNARLEFVTASQDADIADDGTAFLVGHKLRLTGTFDYEWRIECDFGTTEEDSGTYQIDVEIPAPTDYRTDPIRNVQPGQQVEGAFDCMVTETFTCNLFWLLDITYHIVGKATVPGAQTMQDAPNGSASITPAQAEAIDSDSHFHAGAFNYDLTQWINWVDAYGDRDFLYTPVPGDWTGVFLYDYADGAWSSVRYICR